jgi:hypothetical protein
MDSNLYLTCYHDNESKKTIVSSQTLMQYMEQQRQKAVEREREILALRESTIDYIMNILVLE